MIIHWVHKMIDLHVINYRRCLPYTQHLLEIMLGGQRTLVCQCWRWKKNGIYNNIIIQISPRVPATLAARREQMISVGWIEGVSLKSNALTIVGFCKDRSDQPIFSLLRLSTVWSHLHPVSVEFSSHPLQAVKIRV